MFTRACVCVCVCVRACVYSRVRSDCLCLNLHDSLCACIHVWLRPCVRVSACAPVAYEPIPDVHAHVRIHVRACCKLQALVYDILPSTTAVFSYAIGSRKLSANEQFFVGAQTVVRLLQTSQIKQGVSFIAANKVYNSTNKTTIV